MFLSLFKTERKKAGSSSEVRRGPVISVREAAWASGLVDSDKYFAEAFAEALNKTGFGGAERNRSPPMGKRC